jgi:hypothetical protein
MVDPFTHVLYGYVIARSVTPKPGYHALGMLLAVLPDVDALLPGFTHHGWLHSPLFVAFVALTLWGASRDRFMLVLPVLAMGSHLALDGLGALPIGAAGLATAHVFLFLTPAYWVWDRWKRTGESPLAVLEWVNEWVPRPVTWGGVSTFGAMVAFVLAQRLIFAFSF